ncbi:MAG: SDR family oxidoreductase, partial [Desulfuromonadales bacterium]|nr:SDR family oxidoreductase [Desulfuromonadales bacterium]
EACARRLCREGAQVVITGRRLEPLAAVASETGCVAIVGDAASASDMRQVIAEVHERFGGLDILIASAGGHGYGAAIDTDDAAWERSIHANLNTAFVAAREALPLLIERRGVMLLISSIAGLVAGPEVCGYTTMKHALIGLTRSLARDYGPSGVRVNALCPGWVRTPMADEEMGVLMNRHGLSLDGAYQLVTADVPLRRPATPEEIASVCHFLVGDEASIITGSVLVADGGATVVDLPTLVFGRD